ncbi:MAG TPA: hypothetical protein DCP55_03610 [Chitinophagaceae bacterium]|nr:ankyrin repeat domain-containing protein [Pseudomonadota bacterium]HAL95045.1 hypothetical protein [Chitinophagaceae bacterium]
MFSKIKRRQSRFLSLLAYCLTWKNARENILVVVSNLINRRTEMGSLGSVILRYIFLFPGLAQLAIDSCLLYGAEDRVEIVQKIPALQAGIQVDVMENLCAIVGRSDGLQRIKRYLDVDQGNPNLCDQGDQQSLLEIFAFSGNEVMVYSLIEKGAFIPYVDSKGHHAVYMASAEGHANIVEQLLSSVKKMYGSEILEEMLNKGDYRGITALHIAGANGHYQVIEKLLRYHANVDQIDYQGRTALHVACYMGHNGIIDQLLDYGSRLDRTTHKGLTPKDYFKLGEMQESLRRNPRMEAKLTASEQEKKIAQQQYIEDNESLKAFMVTFQRKCGSVFLAYKALESEAIERSKDILAVSNTMNILGNIIPLPGTALVAEFASMGAEMVEDRIEGNKRKLLTELFTTVKEMEEAVEEGSYRLTRRYEAGIKKLTVEGATTLAESGVARFIAYMRDQQTRIKKDKPFPEYILEGVQSQATSSFLESFSLWKVKIQTQDKTLKWTEQDIFAGRIPGILESVSLQQEGYKTSPSPMVFEVSVAEEEEYREVEESNGRSAIDYKGKDREGIAGRKDNQDDSSSYMKSKKDAQKREHAKCCVVS